MEAGLIIYMIFAFAQAIVVARAMKEKTAPGLMVFALCLFAPLVTVALFCDGISGAVKWLVTYKND